VLYLTFHAQGDKYVRLTVTNRKGRSSTTMKTVQVSATSAPTDGDADGVSDAQDACPALAGLPPDGCPSPTPAFSYSPSSPTVGQQVSFDGSATSCYSTPCTYRWSNGTTEFATGQTATLTYQTSGSKTVTLQVTDAQNRTVSLTIGLTVSDPVNAPTLQPVDGGLGYYGQFSNPLPTSPDWFPIAVWGSYNHTQANRDLDAAAGINTYVWVADNSYLTAIRADGRFKVIQEEGSRTNVGSETAGWLLDDEIDMEQANSTGAAQARQQLTSLLSGLPQDGRLRYNNYGKGVIFWNDDSDAEQYVNDFQQLVSDDIYWHSDPGDDCTQWQGGRLFVNATRALTTAECRRSFNYGAVVDRMRYLDGLDGQRKPIWNFVEAGHPFSGGDSIQPAELRAAVWHSIIAGARGIIYFQHSFGGACAGDHHVIRTNCEGTRPMVSSVDAQIKSLAPVLNSPTVTSGNSASSGIRTLVKWNGHNLYVFAGSTGAGSTGQADIPCVGDASASVLGENRSVPVTAGSLRDQFADANTIHIYRIDGGSTCGLPAQSPLVPTTQNPTGLRTRIGRLPRRVSLRGGRLRLPVTCAHACTVRSRLTTRWDSRRVLLASARRRFAVGRRVLVIRLSRRGRRIVERKRRPFAMRVRTTIREPGGRLHRTQRLIARRL
jgi:chitodextrinase